MNQQEQDPLRKFALAMPPLMELRKYPRRYFAEQGHRYEKVIRKIDRLDALFAMYYQKDDEGKLSTWDYRRINRLQRKARAFIFTLQRNCSTAIYGR